MAHLSLQPRFHSGLVTWTLTSLLLHLWWGWEFIIGCLLQLVFMADVLSIYKLPGSTQSPPASSWVLFVLNLIMVITIVAEVCLYANAHLETKKWLVLQMIKFVYIAILYGLYMGLIRPKKDETDLRWEIVCMVLYWIPWIGSFVCGIVAQCTEGNETSVDDEEGVPNERSPLLPKLPQPLSPAVRVAVDRR